MSPQPETCLVRHYVIDPYQIHYLRFIIEAYPGIGVVSTLDSALGLVSIAIAPGCEPEIYQILEAERGNLNLREISPDPESMVKTGAD
ncbi:MAG: DUF4911 domain-containing protein [Syntrophobacteraceae bacterium]